MSGAVLRRLETYVFRYPIATPVQTSFGIMHDRPAVFVRLEDEDGCHGWGEVWCNFPSVGAEHRARLVRDVLGEKVVGYALYDPASLFNHLTQATAVMALQAGERGPLAQSIAAVDLAAWDIMAKRAGLPLWRYLGGTSPHIAVYASGINPQEPARLARAKFAEGHRAFKIKIGFGAARDIRNLQEVRSALGAAHLAADVNQAWSFDDALAMIPSLTAFDLAWLEEPLRCDRPWHEWRQLAQAGAPPLAAGENLDTAAQFGAALREGDLAVIQPDATKWGGFSGCLPVAQAIREAGKKVCPHFLGGGIGLVASAHLLAAAGGDGMLEVDANENPLRDLIAGSQLTVTQGMVCLSDQPGLGIEPDLESIAQYRVRHVRL